jgi:hypothetical protein
MFLWYPVVDLARAPRRIARKKGSGYENVWLRAWLNINNYRLAVIEIIYKQLRLSV